MRDLIILAMGPTRDECPFDTEVWGVNNGYRQVAKLNGRLDKLFICHRGQEYDFEGDPVFNWVELNDLADKGVEIMSLFPLRKVRKTTRLPYKDMVKRFGTEYFTDSVAYMLAYALYQETELSDGVLKLKRPMRIRTYGCDMHSQDEYATERGGIEYFIAIAKTIGVDISWTKDSTLCRTATGKPYGFWKLDKKALDPHKILKLQKTFKGLRKMWDMELITAQQYDTMKETLGEIKASKQKRPGANVSVAV